MKSASKSRVVLSFDPPQIKKLSGVCVCLWQYAFGAEPLPRVVVALCRNYFSYPS